VLEGVLVSVLVGALVGALGGAFAGAFVGAFVGMFVFVFVFGVPAAVLLSEHAASDRISASNPAIAATVRHGVAFE